MSRLLVLVAVTLALAIAMPGSTQATSLNEIKKITASDAQANDSFGVSVAASGDTLVVGAVGADGAGDHAGAVYVFQRDQGGVGTWGEVTKLTASDAEAFDSVGISVAFSGVTAVLGASDEDAGGNEAGAAYVFERDEGGADNWGELKKLTASDPQAGDRFGLSVAITCGTVAVGAPGAATPTTPAAAARRAPRSPPRQAGRGDRGTKTVPALAARGHVPGNRVSARHPRRRCGRYPSIASHCGIRSCSPVSSSVIASQVARTFMPMLKSSSSTFRQLPTTRTCG